MSASSSAMRTRCGVRASSSVMTDIVPWTALILDRGAVSRLAWTDPLWWEAVVSRPSYPNWQRKRIQNPSSVSSNLTEGTHTVETLAQLAWAQFCGLPPVRYLRPFVVAWTQCTNGRPRIGQCDGVP